MLQSQATICNDFKTVQAIVAESRIEIYFVRSVQAKKPSTQVAKTTCYTLQPTCNLSRNAIAAHKLQRKLHCVTLAAEPGFTFCNYYRDV